MEANNKPTPELADTIARLNGLAREFMVQMGVLMRTVSEKGYTPPVRTSLDVSVLEEAGIVLTNSCKGVDCPEPVTELKVAGTDSAENAALTVISLYDQAKAELSAKVAGTPEKKPLVLPGDKKLPDWNHPYDAKALTVGDYELVHAQSRNDFTRYDEQSQMFGEYAVYCDEFNLYYVEDTELKDWRPILPPGTFKTESDMNMVHEPRIGRVAFVEDTLCTHIWNGVHWSVVGWGLNVKMYQTSLDVETKADESTIHDQAAAASKATEALVEQLLESEASVPTEAVVSLPTEADISSDVDLLAENRRVQTAEKVADMFSEMLASAAYNTGRGTLRPGVGGLKKYTESITEHPLHLTKDWPTGFYIGHKEAEQQFHLRTASARIIIPSTFGVNGHLPILVNFTGTGPEMDVLWDLRQNELDLLLRSIPEAFRPFIEAANPLFEVKPDDKAA